MSITDPDIDFADRAIIASRVRRRVTGSRVAWNHGTLHVRVSRARMAGAIREAGSEVRALARDLRLSHIDYVVELDVREQRR